MSKSCFVIMAIGDQRVNGEVAITESKLRDRYADLIKEAVSRARPGIEIVRADEVASPGSITTDILTRLMHSHYVIADVSFPNPNVFYELGVRHACRSGAIIVRERGAGPVPFDIASMRYTEYENTPSGLKTLSHALQQKFDWIDAHVGQPDNHVLELAKILEYQYPFYKKPSIEDDFTAAMLAAIQVPELLELMASKDRGETMDTAKLMSVLAKNPSVAGSLLKVFARSGQIPVSSTRSLPN